MLLLSFPLALVAAGCGAGAAKPFVPSATASCLRQHGFRDEDIWDIAEIAAMYNYTNRLASAAGWLPNPEYHGLAR